MKNVIEGAQSVSLSCNIEAHPRPNVKWFYNGNIHHGNITVGDLEVTDIKSVVRSTLAFSRGMKRSDSGTYACNASNLIGSTKKSVKFYVWCKCLVIMSFKSSRNLGFLGEKYNNAIRSIRFEMTFGFLSLNVQLHQGGFRIQKDVI